MIFSKIVLEFILIEIKNDNCDVVFTDFGSSKIIDKDCECELNSSTDQYASPEGFFSPFLVSSKSDVYSLGLIGLELITPVSKDDFSKLKKKEYFKETWEKIRKNITGSIEQKFLSLIREMLEIEKEKRPTANQIVEKVKFFFSLRLSKVFD